MSAKVHFSGLDGLRFISISFVVLHHLFTFKTNFGYNRYDLPVLGDIGYYGIQFFFAGSGFLITYLLLKEYDKNKAISLRSFYIRRVLRIWPAYYLLILLALYPVLHTGFFRIPGLTDAYLQSNYHKGNLLYLFFLPHIAPFSFPTVPYVHQTYTIGIEEQFYFLWGLLFVLVPRIGRNFFIRLIAAVLLLNVFHDVCFATMSQEDMPRWSLPLMKAATYIKYSRFSTFAIGSLFAFSFFQNRQWIKVFRSAYFQVFIYLLLIVSIKYRFSIPYFHDEYISIVMLCVFGIATFREDSFIPYSAGWLSFLGKISYGIYLFHIFAIVLAIKVNALIFPGREEDLLSLSSLVLMTMAFAILLGYISYFTIEAFFLNIKKRFERL